MDATDLEILKILKKDARTKYVRIADSVGLTEGAVRRRVKKMVEQGAIRKFTVETTVDFEGVVLVETEPTRTGETTAKMREVADRVFEVSGNYDIAAFIRASTMDDLNRKIDIIRTLPGFSIQTRW